MATALEPKFQTKLNKIPCTDCQTLNMFNATTKVEQSPHGGYFVHLKCKKCPGGGEHLLIYEKVNGKLSVIYL